MPSITSFNFAHVHLLVNHVPTIGSVVALGLLIVYLLLSCEIYLATYTLGKFEISFWKFSPTELRILLAAGNVALFLNPAAYNDGGPAGPLTQRRRPRR